MKITREQKIYGAVLCLGLVALAWDKLAASPQQAQATEDPAALLVQPAAAVKASRPAVPATAPVSMAQRLRMLPQAGAPADRLTDVFLPAESWRGQSPKAASGPGAAQRFAQSHKLDGVMIADNRRRAIVDGRSLVVGQTLDGFTLASVAPRQAVFTGPDGDVTLPLQVKEEQLAGDPR
jgi:hypothetical protein